MTELQTETSPKLETGGGDKLLRAHIVERKNLPVKPGDFAICGKRLKGVQPDTKNICPQCLAIMKRRALG